MMGTWVSGIVCAQVIRRAQSCVVIHWAPLWDMVRKGIEKQDGGRIISWLWELESEV